VEHNTRERKFPMTFAELNETFEKFMSFEVRDDSLEAIAASLAYATALEQVTEEVIASDDHQAALDLQALMNAHQARQEVRLTLQERIFIELLGMIPGMGEMVHHLAIEELERKAQVN